MAGTPVTVTITGAGGQIGYAAMFRIAAGELLGKNQPVNLRLLEIPQGMRAAEGAALELADCAFPLLADIELTDSAAHAFKNTNLALLIGSRPRTQGMERADLIEANGAIFGPQGKAINDNAADNVRIAVVGNPANTNALIAMRNAPDIPAGRFSALTRLDHNRAVAMLAAKTDSTINDVKGVTVWGNHSATQYPDLSHATVAGKPALNLIPAEWARGEYVTRIQKRGAEVIAVRGASSAASAANAVLDHCRDWLHGTPANTHTSASLLSRGEYATPAGVFCSFPVTAKNGDWQIVESLSVDSFSQQKIAASCKELETERETVTALGLL